MNLGDILGAEAAAIEALDAADPGAWQQLLEHLADDGAVERPVAAPRVFVEALMARDARLDRWHDRAKRAAVEMDSETFTTVAAAVRPFKAWLAEGIRLALPPNHPASLECRYLVLLDHPGDDAASLVRQLVDDLRASVGPVLLLGEALLLLARRADEAGDHEGALAASDDAARVFEALGNTAAIAAAQRARGTSLLRSGQVDAALAVLDAVLDAPGPRFGGGGAHRTVTTDDPAVAALHEAATVASWADRRTPEWVRALGAIAENVANATCRARFHAALEEMVAGSRSPIGDLEVVIRQASERSLELTASAAADLLARKHPADLVAAGIAGSFFHTRGEFARAATIYAQAAAANDADAMVGLAWLRAAELAGRAGDGARAKEYLALARAHVDGSDLAINARVALADIDARLGRHSAEAANELFALYERVAAHRTLLGDTNAGTDIAHAAIESLLAENDRRALVVAEALLAAKKDLFGDRPATWLEGHTLGRVYLAFGDRNRARELLVQALLGLRGSLGREHAQTKAVEATLTALEASAPDGT